MACKNRQPEKRCGDCQCINRDAYRGVGEEVCYELQCDGDRKVAVKVSENQKACNKFRDMEKIGRAG